MLTLHIEQDLADSSQEPGAGPVLRRSQMHLVDLAGSERYNDACSDGARRKEARSFQAWLPSLHPLHPLHPLHSLHPLHPLPSLYVPTHTAARRHATSTAAHYTP